jgi:hypothetical protein
MPVADTRADAEFAVAIVTGPFAPPDWTVTVE